MKSGEPILSWNGIMTIWARLSKKKIKIKRYILWFFGTKQFCSGNPIVNFTGFTEFTESSTCDYWIQQIQMFPAVGGARGINLLGTIGQGVRWGYQGDVGWWQNWSCPKQTFMCCPVPFMASDDFCKKNECKISFPRQDIAQIWWHLNSTFKNCFSPFMRRYLTSKLNEIDKLGG